MIMLLRASIVNSYRGLKGVPLTAPPFGSISNVLILASLTYYALVSVSTYAYQFELVEHLVILLVCFCEFWPFWLVWVRLV
jgi:hypothetical protein